jgi:hypothetical protein
MLGATIDEVNPGAHRASVAQALHRNGVPVRSASETRHLRQTWRGPRVSEAQRRELCELYLLGATIDELRLDIGKSYVWVRSTLTAYGIPLRTAEETHILRGYREARGSSRGRSAVA